MQPAPARRKSPFEEVARLAVVMLLAVWMTSPFMKQGLIGGGDSVWYHHQVADAVTQMRSGVFPVFTGQTHFAFNGAVHPLRTAPLLLNLTGLVDVLTGRQLEFYRLLNITAQGCLILAALGAYLSLCWLGPEARWRAVALSIVYVGSPGVLGLVFAQDLYMSATATPWLPCAAAALIKIHGRAKRLAYFVLGCSLGALWWAHSPLALWMTLLAAVIVALNLLHDWRNGGLREALGSAIPGGIACLALAMFPIVSVVSLREKGERVVPRVLDREHLMREVEMAFPHIFQPVDLQGPLLHMVQPGFSALACLGIAAIGAIGVGRERRRAILGLVAGGLIFLSLIVPIPGVTRTVWMHMPEMWASMTNIWPMQRFVPLAVAVSVVSAQAVMSTLALLGTGRGMQPLNVPRSAGLGRVVDGVLALLLAWALWQAAAVVELGRSRTVPEKETRQLAEETNANLSEIAYQQLSGRPGYFIHGVTDPEMELRLLDQQTGALLASNKSTLENLSAAPWHDLQLKRTSNPALWVFPQPLPLDPGKRYLITFDFKSPSISGLLRFAGEDLYRVYVLPSAGEPKGFGLRPGQERSLVLWGTSRTSQATLEFIPDGTMSSSLATQGGLGRFRVTEIDSELLPVEMLSLTPLRLRAKADTPSVLETMRVHIPGWSAMVNGVDAAVSRTQDGLVGILVPPGTSQVDVFYRAPLVVRAAFWCSLFVAIAAVPAGILIWRREAR